MEREPESETGRTLVGAAAADKTAGADPPLAPAPPGSSERSFRLRAGEAVADGIRRVACWQLADAAEALRDAEGEALGPAVHAARKRIKRVRAALRLSRGAIDERVFARENEELRAIAARLSAARDARVLTETLADLEGRFAADLPADATAELRARLHGEHERALAALRLGDAVRETADALAQMRGRTAGWAFAGDGFAALEPALRGILHRGRKRMRAAREEPSAENLHDWRKRVKDLWHVAELLHAARPKRLARLARRTHELADLLGDHHDLSVLREYVVAHPELFEHAASRDALLAVIDRRRDSLQDGALELGDVVPRRAPKRFIAAIERGWRKHVESS
jgi:CHAD domain-containing protein